MPARWLLPSLLFVVVLSCGNAASFAAEPLEGYLNYDAYSARVTELGKRDGVKVSSLGKSRQDRDLWLIEIGSLPAPVLQEGQPASLLNRPAWVVVGAIEPDQPLGSELALRMAEELVEKAGKDAAIDALLKRCTLYIIPRPDPDSLEKCFGKPMQLAAGNARPTDDDRDFTTGEDPPNDLNSDGFITQLRIEDETGSYRLHPDDSRLLIEVDPKKQESATHRLLSEGTDDDHDEAFNEDAAGGVNLNRNFTFHYAPFQTNTGPNAVSEPESRALADFLFNHPQIAGIFTCSTEDNLFHPWKHDGGKDKGKIRNTIAPQDETVLARLAEDYRTLHGGKECPPSASGQGSFSEWAYFHFGRWSFASRSWWVPNVPVEEAKKKEAKSDEEKKLDAEKPVDETKPTNEKKKKEEEKRGADERNAFRWLQQQKIDGFVDWKPIEHPDFPGKKVEVGGFKPFVLTQPQASELNGIAAKQVQFLCQLGAQLPELALVDSKVEALGGNTFRITTQVVNRGQLPTMSEMGAITEQVHPLQIALDLPEKTQWLVGHPRGIVPRLKGQGGKVERTWVVHLEGEIPPSVKFRVWSPSVGEVEVVVEIPR